MEDWVAFGQWVDVLPIRSRAMTACSNLLTIEIVPHKPAISNILTHINSCAYHNHALNLLRRPSHSENKHLFPSTAQACTIFTSKFTSSLHQALTSLDIVLITGSPFQT